MERLREMRAKKLTTWGSGAKTLGIKYNYRIFNAATL